MFCKNCGKEVQEDWTSCPHCGAEIKKKNEKKESIQNVDNHIDKKKKKPFSKKKVIAIIAAFGIIIVAMSTFGDSETSEPEEITNGGNAEDTVNTENAENTENTENTEDIENIDDNLAKDNENLEYTVSELYTTLQSNGVYPYELNEKALQFLSEHEDCFPVTDYKHIENLVDTSIEYRHIEKNASKYGDKLMEISELYVMSIEEEEIGNSIFTAIQAVDAGENIYVIFYNGSLEDVFKEDIIKVDILPFGVTSYDNVSGGTTNAVIGAGSYIEKIE